MNARVQSRASFNANRGAHAALWCGLLIVAALATSAQGLAAHKAAPSLYWTNYGVSGTGGTIGRANLDGSNTAQSFIKGASGPVGVVVHGGYIYWSNPGVDAGSPGTTIGRAKLDGSDVNQSFISGVNSPHSLAISGGYIYWASRYGNTIGRAKLDGTGVNSSFITGAIGPWGIAVSGNYVYWTNYGANGGSDGTTIGRASINGKGANQSFITGAGAPAGITVFGGHIYWSNQGTNESGTTIGRASLDGQSVNESFITGADSPAGLDDPRLVHLLVELRRAPRHARHDDRPRELNGSARTRSSSAAPAARWASRRASDPRRERLDESAVTRRA